MWAIFDLKITFQEELFIESGNSRDTLFENYYVFYVNPIKSMFTSSHYIEGCWTNVSLAALSLFFYCGCSTISIDL